VNSKLSELITLGLAVCFLAPAARAADPPITSVALAPDGKSVVACSQAGSRVYSWPELKPRKKLETTAANLHHVAFSPEGKRLAVGGEMPAEEGTVEIFSWPDGRPLRALDDHHDCVMDIAWLGKSTLASASLDHSIIVWDTETGSPTQRLEGHSRGVSSLCFVAQKRLLVSSGLDRSLRVWSLDRSDLIHSLDHHTLPVHDIALRPAAPGLPMLASVSDDRTVRLWQPTIGRMVRFVRLSSRPLDVDWLPDGSTVVVACADGRVRRIDPAEAKVTEDIPAVDGWAYSLAVHPADGSIVVGGRDGQIRRVVTGPAKDSADTNGR